MPRVLYAIPGALSKTALGPEEVQRREKVLSSWSAPDVDVAVRDVPTGPASIESALEEYLSVFPTAALLRDAEQEGFDAAVLGCFGDPGLDALREITTRMPVVGPGEAAFHVASMLGERFGIVTVAHGVVSPLRHLVARSGLSERLAGIAVAETSVLDVTGNRDGMIDAVIEQGRALIERRDADALVLGCMSLAFLDITAHLEDALGVPVVNPAKAGLYTAEMLARAQLRHSKRTYPQPAKLATGTVARVEDLLF
jgi:allantoin racemase